MILRAKTIRSFRSFLLTLITAILTVVGLFHNASAFSTDVVMAPSFLQASSSSSSSRTGRNRSVDVDFSLKMSDGGSKNTQEGDDDEISKLIGKRSQIKRKKNKETGNAIEDKLMESIEPTVDLDLDKLPEFKTERPTRRKSNDSDEDGDTTDADGDSKKKETDAGPIVDFLADYDDENDWHIPNRIGVTTRAWGDPSQGFVDVTHKTKNKKLTKRMLKAGKFVAGDVQLAVTKLLEGGITLLETSPTYGAVSKPKKLSAEDILKQCLSEVDDAGLPEAVVMENLPSIYRALWRPGNKMVAALENSLTAIGGDESSGVVEVFMAPRGPFVIPTRLIAAGLAAQIESGQANYVGVSGIQSVSAVKRLKNHLEDRDCTLTAASFDFSLTGGNKNGEAMIDACKDLGVVPIITDPLDGGLSSGVFTATNPSGGGIASGDAGRRKFTFAQLEKLQPLHSVQETVAERVRTRVMRGMRDTQERFKSKYGPPPKINTDITTTQVALNWIIAKGGVPLPQVNSPAQAEEVLGCLGWTLTDEEVDMIDSAVALCKL